MLADGEIEGRLPLRVVLLAPATHPAGAIPLNPWHTNLVAEEVPGIVPQAVNLCAKGDYACPLEIRNARNINPPNYGHSRRKHTMPRGYADIIIHSLNVEGHRNANPHRYRNDR